MAVNLGDKVRDTISGLEGIAVIKSYHLNGCVQITIEGRAKKNGTHTFDRVDIDRVEVVAPSAFQGQGHEEAASPGFVGVPDEDDPHRHTDR